MKRLPLILLCLFLSASARAQNCFIGQGQGCTVQLSASMPGMANGVLVTGPTAYPSISQTLPAITLTSPNVFGNMTVPNGSILLGGATGGFGPIGSINATSLLINGVPIGSGGVAIPTSPLLSGNGSLLGGVALGTNLSISGTFPNQTLNATGGGGSGTVTSIIFSAPLTGGTITTSGTVGLGGPSNLTTFTAGTVPMGAGASAFVASEITDVALGGVVIGSPTGGAKGAGTVNMAGCFINNVACASGGSTAFSAITAGTNTSAAMVIGTGASLAATGSGTITATAMPATGLTGTMNAAQLPAFTGDVTSPSGSSVNTLATVNSNVGSFTNANITVNGKGLITAAANGSGGSGTPVVFVGTTAGTANAQTIVSPTPSGYALTDGYVVKFTVGAGLTNTSSPTLAVNSTTAYSIVKQNSTGTYAALTGGELIAGQQYEVIYHASSTQYVLTTILANDAPTGVTDTVTQQKWENCHPYTISTAAQTITLPVATTLGTGGCIILQTMGVTATLTPNAFDGINGGAINTSINIPADITTIVTTSGASGINAFTVPLGPLQYGWQPWAVGLDMSLSTHGIRVSRVGTPRILFSIRCINDVAEGSASALSFFQQTNSGLLDAGTNLISGSGTFDMTTTAGTEVTLTLASSPTLIPANYYWGIKQVGSSSTGSGMCTFSYR